MTESVYAELGIPWSGYDQLKNADFPIESDNDLAYRSHPKLIAAIEKVGEKSASAKMARLVIVDIPGGTDWEIDECDGFETVYEKNHRW